MEILVGIAIGMAVGFLIGFRAGYKTISEMASKLYDENRILKGEIPWHE